jgi:aspartyl-tRNA(Asn)/glutamyl-tRNA(Gln) amidotransferase subunit B
MEEDTAKMMHGRSITEHATTSLVDFNRSGVPLLEIVSAPDITSAEEASAYLTELRAILRTLGISSGNMEEGALRCDVNISLDASTRAEVKNVNSFRSVRKALEYEIERQNASLDRGEPVVQETRHFKESSGITVSGRTKEEAEDYRYFPEPDLVSLEITPQWIDTVRQRLPELPEERRRRLGEMGLFPAEAATIANAPELARFFDRTLSLYPHGKEIANWLLSEVSKTLNARNCTIDEIPLRPEGLAELLQMVHQGTISSRIGKTVIAEMLATGKGAGEVVQEKALGQILDPETIRGWVQKILAQNPKEQEAYRQGKDALFGFFVGQAMKRSGGKANPELLNRIVREELGK